jgi:hypothetical protein
VRYDQIEVQISRRLARLEERAGMTAPEREPNVLCLVNTRMQVTGTAEWRDGKPVWTKFEPSEWKTFEGSAQSPAVAR